MGLPSEDWATWCERPGCAKPIPVGRQTAKTKYCSDSCCANAYRQRQLALKDPFYLQKRANNAKIRVGRPSKGETARRGPRYAEFLESEWPAQIIAENFTMAEVARRTEWGATDIGRWMAAHREDVRKEAYAEKVQAEAEGRGERHLSFPEFRSRFFHTVDPKGVRISYATPDFQQRWIARIDETIEGGSRLLILSPPRHGKTEMLIHYVIYRICMQPNIRILWVALNEDIAKQSVELVRQELEDNTDLINIYGGKTGFRPESRTSATSWSATKIKVATRTTPLKSATVAAVGRGGKLLSRDADLIILDDIVDHSTTNSPAQRESDWRWLRTQISSRKMMHTAIVAIGSRQHPEDIYSELLASTVWSSIVESVHDQACLLDPNDLAAHVDCMLFAAMNPYEWAMNMREDLGSHLFDMVYMNISVPKGIRTFTAATVKACASPEHRIGHVPRGTRLVAGLDPATAGYQAAFLWAVDVRTMTRWMVDSENDKGGGLPRAREIIREWFSRYGLRHWVVEGNNFQSAVRQDIDIMRFAAANGIRVEGHFTHGHNKWDEQFGVTAMATLFADRKIVLPYADVASAEKTDAYVKQLLRFEGQGTGRQRHASDLVMSSWFPETQIRRWRVEHVRTMEVEHEQTEYPWTTIGGDGVRVLTSNGPLSDAGLQLASATGSRS